MSSSTNKEAVFWLNVIPLTGMKGIVTVTSQVAEQSPAVAVIVAVPAPTAVTLPF